MELLRKGWFSEVNTQWPGQAMSLEVEEVLFSGRSKFQDVLVFKSKTYGTVLVLDGVIQITDRDEFAYQEMICNLPMFAHDNPKNVLIVGGGDGGVLAQVCKHKLVESVTICEIDELVIETSKKYFPKFRHAWSDPRVNLQIGDGVEFVKGTSERYDVIIVDSSDPVGPAEGLFSASFYREMRKVLREGGIACTQTECTWLHLDFIKKMKRDAQQLYPQVEYAFTTLPTYPSGQIGFLLNSLAPHSVKKPRRQPTEETFDHPNDLLYYNSEMHEAAFVLPEFARKALDF